MALTYWKSLEGPRHDAQVKLTDDFNAGRDDVKVTLEHVGAYDQAAEKLGVALASGTPPDVMLLTVNSHMPAFARLGALQPQDEFVRADKGAQFEKYYPTFIQNGQVGGKQYQIPFARSTPLLYFNRDLLRAAGVPEEAPDDLGRGALARAAHRALRRPHRAGRGHAGALPGEQRLVDLPVHALDVRRGLLRSAVRDQDQRPESVQAGQFFSDLMHRHRVADSARSAQNEFLQGSGPTSPSRRPT